MIMGTLVGLLGFIISQLTILNMKLIARGKNMAIIPSLTT